jgi:hypothetical protein
MAADDAPRTGVRRRALSCTCEDDQLDGLLAQLVAAIDAGVIAADDLPPDVAAALAAWRGDDADAAPPPPQAAPAASGHEPSGGCPAHTRTRDQRRTCGREPSGWQPASTRMRRRWDRRWADAATTVAETRAVDAVEHAATRPATWPDDLDDPDPELADEAAAGPFAPAYDLPPPTTRQRDLTGTLAAAAAAPPACAGVPAAA